MHFTFQCATFVVDIVFVVCVVIAGVDVVVIPAPALDPRPCVTEEPVLLHVYNSTNTILIVHYIAPLYNFTHTI